MNDLVRHLRNMRRRSCNPWVVFRRRMAVGLIVATLIMMVSVLR